MPKFEPVAQVVEELGTGKKVIFDSNKALYETPLWVKLYSADQLTEAYEAGKREASEDIEQAAFEKWLYDKCPSGDVESVQRQWLESYEYAELAEKRDAIPEGWVLVPMEPDEEMELRGAECTNSIDWGDCPGDAPYELASAVYAAMIEAAPKGLK